MAIVAEDLKPFVASSSGGFNKKKEIEEQTDNTENIDVPAAKGILLPKIFPSQSEYVWPVSSSTGAGINPLWRFLRRCANQDSTPYINPKSKYCVLYVVIL